MISNGAEFGELCYRESRRGMSIELSSELEQLIQSQVASGRYNSASDVLKDALRLLEEQDRYIALHKNEIREKIARGYNSLRTGKGVDGEAAFERLEKEIAATERSPA
jgi:antitoxin ParD1/3/4